MKGFSNLSYKKNKKEYIKKEFFKKGANPSQPFTKGGINYKNRFQKNVTRRICTI
nr:MAG TPA: hypothetical protein [Caudoviricetes sp.]